MNQVIIMLNGSEIVQVVLAIGLSCDFETTQFSKPRFPLVRPVERERIRGKERASGLFPDPVNVETVISIKNSGFHSIKNFECTYDCPSGKSLNGQFTFRHLSDKFTEFLDFGKAYRTCIPGS